MRISEGPGSSERHEGGSATAPMVCSRCGRTIQVSRCLTCGGTPVAAPLDAGLLDSTQPDTKTASDGADPSKDPRLIEAEGRVSRQQGKIGQLDRQVLAATEELGFQLGVLRADVDSAISGLDRMLTADLSAIAAERQAAIAQFGRDERVRKTQLGSSVVAAGTKARDAATAFGLLSPAVAHIGLQQFDLCPALSVRPMAHLGTVKFPQAAAANLSIPTLPALVPLINQGHVVIEGPSGDPQVESMLNHVVAQAFASAPGGQMVVTVFDPKMKSTLAGFQAHGASTEAKILVNVHPSQEALEKVLGEHLGYMIAVGASTAKQYASMGDLVAATGQHEHQYRTLVILDAPAFWSEKIADDLHRIVDQGASAGISVILHRDPAVPSPRDVDLGTVLAGASHVRREAGADWTVAIPGVKVVPKFTPAPGPSLAAQQRLMELVVASAKEGVLPKVPFLELADRAPWWTADGAPRSSANGVKIILGRKGNQTVSFTLGDTVSNLHNVLVGGRAGSGKTVLLKAMIYSMAARYSPDELRLFLLDYKEGVEFQQFIATPDARNPLPHAAVVSIESDAQFGLATLSHFLQELKSRSEEFKRIGNVQNIAEYRKRTGAVMPRWVLLIDEFQGMFAGPGYVEATVALEDLVRRGRSFGLHVVLASQTLSGIRFDGDKDKAIFENVPARIVLQLGPDEATKFLQSGNDGAAQLRYRGQAILNTQGGAPGDNQQFVVAFGDQEYFGLQDDLAAAANSLVPRSQRKLRVYHGDQYVSAGELATSNDLPTEVHEALPIWFGQESTVVANAARAELTPTSGSNLLVLGSLDVPAAIATVQTAVLSAAVAAGSLRVLLLESMLRQFRETAGIDAWLDTLRRLGCVVERYGSGDEEKFLDAVKDAAGAGQRALAVLLGPENSDFKNVAEDDWEQLIRELPRNHVNVIGQWSDLRDIPGDTYNLRNDYKTILFVGGDEQLIEQASGRSRHDIPPLKKARTVVFSAASSQQGLATVASIRPLDRDDLEAWETLA